MKFILKTGLLAGAASCALISGSMSEAMAQTASGPAAEAEATTQTIVVVGQGVTYSAAESTEAMALAEAPVTSILAQIDSLPGVLVTEGDTFGFDDWSTGVAVRGFQNSLSDQQIGIAIDGLPNGGSGYGGGSKANRYIDTQNAGAVEVSQGTADIASRSNEALGGTINFTTSDPLDEARARISATIADFDGQRIYGRYDTGLMLDGTTKAWISLATQSATDHIEGSAENRRDHFAAKITSEFADINWTGYVSYDDAAENNYDQLYSEADWLADKNTDRLIGNWTDVPYVNQSYRQVWGTLRENLFAYVKAEKEVIDGLTIEGGLYRHDMDGRGDWAPPYLVNITADAAGGPESEFAGGSTVYGGAPLGFIYFVSPTGAALQADTDVGGACYADTNSDGVNDYVSGITFPYGRAALAYDPVCYPRDAVPAQSYRHTHYQRERYGLTGDVNWEADFGAVRNVVRAGIWYEDGTRYEYRDWHKLTDARIGPDFNAQAYWVQYNREFPQTTFKWYVEDAVTFGDFTVRVGAKQFHNEIDRVDNFSPTNPDLNFTLESESDVLFSGGASWAPSFVDGLEVFAGYAENYKAIPDSVLEVINVDAGIPDPEVADNMEVGVRYVGSRFRGSAVYFQANFENRLFAAPTIGDGEDTPDYLEASNGGFINAGGIESQGFELAGEFDVTDELSLFASYTWNDATILGTGDAQLDTDAGIQVGNTVPGIAETMFVLGADWSGDTFFAGVNAKWVGSRFVNLSNSWEADDYVHTDLYAGVRGEAISDSFKDLDLRLTVNNLFDVDYLSGISGNAAWISAPRTVALTLTADF